MSVSQKIAAALGEVEQIPLETIERVVQVKGEEWALARLEETVALNAEDGLLTNTGDQRRTPGGIFFKLVKNLVESKERQLIFGPAWAAARPVEKLTWEDSLNLSTEALKLPKGEVITVKITVIGRPGRVIEKGSVAITSMQNSNPPALPKGMPQPPKDPTTYIVYMAAKQWEKVKDSIQQNPDDKLIIEGFPMFDQRIGKNGAMTIFALNTTSKLVQQAQPRKRPPLNRK